MIKNKRLLNKKQIKSGFTIVELLIVIVVIGILAALVITTYNGIQQKGRDTKRKTDLKALQSKVEEYYVNNTRYPCLVVTTSTCAADLNSSAFRTANLKGLDTAALQDPKGASASLCTSVSNNCYGYAPTPSGCDDASNGDCANFTLTANLEGGGTFSVKSNN